MRFSSDESNNEENESEVELTDEELYKQISDHSLKRYISTSDLLMKCRLFSVFSLFILVCSFSFLLITLLTLDKDAPGKQYNVLFDLGLNTTLFLMGIRNMHAMKKVVSLRKLRPMASNFFRLTIFIGFFSCSVSKVLLGVTYLLLIPFFAFFIFRQSIGLSWVFVCFIIFMVEIFSFVFVPQTFLKLIPPLAYTQYCLMVQWCFVWSVVLLSAYILSAHISQMKNAIIVLEEKNEHLEFQRQKAEHKTKKKSAFLAGQFQCPNTFDSSE